MNYKRMRIIIIGTIIVLIFICIGLLIFRAHINNSEVPEANNQNEIKYVINKNIEPYEQPLEYYCAGFSNNDLDTFLKSYPKSIQGDLKAEFEKDIEIMEQSMGQSTWELNMESMKYAFGDDYICSYKVNGKKELTENEKNEIEEDLKKEYNYSINIINGYKLDVSIKVSGSKGTKTEDSKSYVFKIGNDWYMHTRPLE